MKKIVLMFIGIWIVVIPAFLLFGADPGDILNIFIANVLVVVILLIYTTIRRKRASP